MSPDAGIVYTSDGGAVGPEMERRSMVPHDDCDVTGRVDWSAQRLDLPAASEASGYSDRGCLIRPSRTEVACWTAGALTTTPLSTDGEILSQIAVGTNDVCVSTAQGVLCWGETPITAEEAAMPAVPRGRMLRAPPEFAPRPVPGVGHVTRLVTGGIQACGLTDDQVLMCWGRNEALGLTRDPWIMAEHVTDFAQGLLLCWLTGNEVWCANPPASPPVRIFCLGPEHPEPC